MTERQEFKPPCEAPIHDNRCDGIGNTVDHFTPKCIGKLLGWSRKQINDTSNLQRLSIPCHREKDASTPKRADILRLEKRGVIIDFEQHREVFSQWD